MKDIDNYGKKKSNVSKEYHRFQNYQNGILHIVSNSLLIQCSNVTQSKYCNERYFIKVLASIKIFLLYLLYYILFLLYLFIILYYICIKYFHYLNVIVIYVIFYFFNILLNEYNLNEQKMNKKFCYLSFLNIVIINN